MINKRFDLINKDDIDSLIANEVPESRTLEYKEQLPGHSDNDKKEFLADISSFANSSGGDLIYGVQEQRDNNNKTTGIPEAAKGLSIINTDAEIRRLEDIIRNGIAPRIVGIQPIAIEGFLSGPAIIMRIPKSWNSPHMVTFKNHSRFYSRSSAGKYPLEVDEIRSAFIASESLAERISQFRTDRIAKIIGDETPFPLRPNPKIVLHVLPISSFSAGASIDLRPIKNASLLRPLYSITSSNRFNFDGVVAYTTSRDSIARSYTQMFRNGCIEAVEASLIEEREKGKLIYSVEYEKQLIRGLEDYLNLQKNLEINPPIFVMLSFLHVKSCTMGVGSDRFDSGQPIDRDIILVPEVVVEDYTDKASHILRPLFDAIWQACGWSGSSNYDENGNWNEGKY